MDEISADEQGIVDLSHIPETFWSQPEAPEPPSIFSRLKIESNARVMLYCEKGKICLWSNLRLLDIRAFVNEMSVPADVQPAVGVAYIEHAERDGVLIKLKTWLAKNK